MNHLIISRQYPPAPNSGGGIATYVRQIAEGLAHLGEIVHVIGQRWPGAAAVRETFVDGRLIIHRVDPNEPGPDGPGRGFQHHSAVLAESLIAAARIDIIEAQEYEAPAFELMRRRAAGVGPPVPVLVHLHTPTEFVYQANGWLRELRDRAGVVAREAGVIRAADALVSPSGFLAEIAEAHYKLRPGSVAVVPYPLGGTFVPIDRDDRTWRDGTIYYAGRLEPRKGVVEWVDAAVETARNSPVHFAFIGADTSSPDEGIESMLKLLRSRVPAELRPHFTFHGEVPRQQLRGHLARARIAVVPSRWENFPYTCMEAMASGVPVITTPNGGMAEMIEHGRTGWIAKTADASNLRITLLEALAAPPDVVAEMGAAAAKSIRRLCNDDVVVRRQLDLRRKIVAAGCRPPSDLGAALQLPETVSGELVDEAPWDERTMSLTDIVHAPRRQQMALVKRALSDLGYVRQWVAWHGRRAIEKLSHRR